MADERHHVANHLNVVVGETHLHAGLVSASLLGRAAGKDADGSGAKSFEDVLNGAAKTFAVGQQQNHSCNAPGHAQHSKHGLAKVVPHCVISLL